MKRIRLVIATACTPKKGLGAAGYVLSTSSEVNTGVVIDVGASAERVTYRALIHALSRLNEIEPEPCLVWVETNSFAAAKSITELSKLPADQIEAIAAGNNDLIEAIAHHLNKYILTAHYLKNHVRYPQRTKAQELATDAVNSFRAR